MAEKLLVGSSEKLEKDSSDDSKSGMEEAVGAEDWEPEGASEGCGSSSLRVLDRGACCGLHSIDTSKACSFPVLLQMDPSPKAAYGDAPCEDDMLLLLLLCYEECGLKTTRDRRRSVKIQDAPNRQQLSYCSHHFRCLFMPVGLT